MLMSMLLAGILTGCGFASVGSDEPGYARFDLPRGADESFSLTLGPTSLHLLRWAVDDDAQFAGVEAVRVYTAEGVSFQPGVESLLRGNAAALRSEGWDAVVKVRDEGEWTQMLVKIEAGDIVGLVVLSAENEEVVFVNILGKLTPDTIPGILDDLDAEVPDVAVTLGI